MSRSVFIFLFTMLSSILFLGCIQSRCLDEGMSCTPTNQPGSDSTGNPNESDIEIPIEGEDNQYVDAISMRTRKATNQGTQINAWIGLSLRNKSDHTQHTVLLSLINRLGTKQKITTPCTMKDRNTKHRIGIIMTDSYLMFPCNDQSDTNPSLNKYYFDNSSQDTNKITTCKSIWSLSSNNHGDAFGMLRDNCDAGCGDCTPLSAVVSGSSVMQANILDLQKINSPINKTFSAQLALFGHFTYDPTPDWFVLGEIANNNSDSTSTQALRAVVPQGFSFITSLLNDTVLKQATECIAAQNCAIATGNIDDNKKDDIIISRDGEIKFYKNTPNNSKETPIPSFTEDTSKKITIGNEYINDAIAITNDELGTFLTYSKQRITDNKISIIIHKIN